ncbi:FAD-dependent oxidoreductase [Synechocystis sp. B12]|nr:FAD-dependent oxidoreductase [Synechocystis sp. B12]
MENFDAIVVGAGITGAAIAYELQNQGQRVLLLEKHRQPINATALSYGGIIYWAGATPCSGNWATKVAIVGPI